ncbi:MAG: ParA family protein [Nanoarchaeota archaeon]|nr:ParA family protein [Nanoarchaeota archaeon]
MIISVAAQKGGVGKTSLTLHLSGAFAENSKKVLLCDVDPQHSLSNTFVQDVYSLEKTLKELLTDPDLSASQVLCRTKFENIDIIPSNLGLGLIEYELLSEPDSQYLLADKLDEVRKDYGLVLIDCPPSLGIFTRLALTASDSVLIPLECSSYAVKSTGFLLELIQKIKKRANPELRLSGFVINKIDSRRRVEQDFRDMIRQNFGEKVFKTELKDSAKYAEAVTLKIPISFYQPKSEQAEACRELLKEILNAKA